MFILDGHFPDVLFKEFFNLLLPECFHDCDIPRIEPVKTLLPD
jgi:hypothetical protein